MIRITKSISLDENEIHESYVRGSGPGGQHVNKTSSAVQLRFDAANSPSIPDDVRERLLRLAGSRCTADGVIMIEARRYRSQDRNRVDALERLKSLIQKAAAPPVPRKKSKPSRTAKKKRVDEKRRRSETKRLRKGPTREES